MTIPTISTLPTAPARTDAPATFISRADAFLAALVTMQGELNTSIGAMNTDIAGVDADATAAAASAAAAASSATAAANAAGAALWVSGQSYDEGDAAISLVNYQTYRAETATSGTTDPSLDANWTAISGTFPDQTASAGKYLTTDGTNPNWDDPIPAQSGNAGKYLTTDGTDASWAAVSSGIINMQARENISAGDIVQVGHNGGIIKCKSSERVRTWPMLIGLDSTYETSLIGYFPDYDYFVTVTYTYNERAIISTWRFVDEYLQLIKSTYYDANDLRAYDFGKMIYDPSSSRMFAVYRAWSGNNLNGAVFTVNADGTVSDIVVTTIKTVSSINAASCAYDANAERILIVYNDTGSAGYARTIQIDPADNSITAGTESSSFDSNPRYLCVEYDPVNESCAAVYQASANNGQSIVFTIDAATDTVSYGLPVVFQSGTTTWVTFTYDDFVERFVAFYSYNSDLYGSIGYVSGTGMVWGTPDQIRSTNGIYGTCVYHKLEKNYYVLSSDGQIGELHRLKANSGLTGFDLILSEDISQNTDGDQPYMQPRYGVYDDTNGIGYLPAFWENGSGAATVMAIAGSSLASTISTTSLGTSTGSDQWNQNILHLKDYSGGENSYLFAYTDSARDLQVRIGTVNFVDGSISLGSETLIDAGSDSGVYCWYDLNIQRVVITWLDSSFALKYRMADVDIAAKSLTLDTSSTLSLPLSPSGEDRWSISYSNKMRKAYANACNSTSYYAYTIQAANTSLLTVASTNVTGLHTQDSGGMFVEVIDSFPMVVLGGRQSSTGYITLFELSGGTTSPITYNDAQSFANAFSGTGATYIQELNILAIATRTTFLLYRPNKNTNVYSMVNFATDSQYTSDSTALDNYLHYIFWDKRLSSFVHFYENKLYIHHYDGTSLTGLGEHTWDGLSGGTKQGYIVHNEENGTYLSINNRGGTDVKLISINKFASDGAIGIATETISSGSTGEIASTGALYSSGSDLITGANYYVNNYGNLTTMGSGAPFAKAISSTQLVIK